MQAQIVAWRVSKRALVGALVVLLLGTTIAPSATAAKASLPDARGDAVRAVDITRLVVNNRPAKVRVTARVPRFKPGRTDLVNVVVRVRSKDVSPTEYTLITERDGSSIRTTLWKVPFATGIPPSEQPVPCPQLKVRWVKNERAIAVIPRSCLVTTEKVRAGVYIQRRNATRARHTDWAPGSYARLGAVVPRG